MARKARTYHHGDLARALVDAGRALLTEQGIDRLSLRGVAARVGVSQTAPYSHFADKKALLRAISASGFQDLADRLDALRSETTCPRERIIGYGATYVDFALEHPDLYRLMISSLGPLERDAATGDSRDALLSQATRPFALLREAFHELEPDPARAENLSLGAWSMVHGLASLMGEQLITSPPGGARDVLSALMEAQTPPD